MRQNQSWTSTVPLMLCSLVTSYSVTTIQQRTCQACSCRYCCTQLLRLGSAPTYLKLVPPHAQWNLLCPLLSVVFLLLSAQGRRSRMDILCLDHGCLFVWGLLDGDLVGVSCTWQTTLSLAVAYRSALIQIQAQCEITSNSSFDAMPLPIDDFQQFRLLTA